MDMRRESPSRLERGLRAGSDASSYVGTPQPAASMSGSGCEKDLRHEPANEWRKKNAPSREDGDARGRRRTSVAEFGGGLTHRELVEAGESGRERGWSVARCVLARHRPAVEAKKCIGIFHLASEIATSDIFRRPPLPADAHSRARVTRRRAPTRVFRAPTLRRRETEGPRSCPASARKKADPPRCFVRCSACRRRTTRPSKDLHFVGGEEEAHDYFHRKWEANRRTSLDERQREAHQRAVVAPLAAGADAAKASTTIHAAHPSSRHAAQKKFFDGAFALGGVLPAGNATLAPATAATRKTSVAVPEVDSNDWY